MRALVPIVLILLFAAPASALLAPRATDLAPVAPFPADMRDGDVLLLIGAHMGLAPTRLPIPTPTDTSMAPVLMRLAERAGTPMTIDEAVQFDTLDARITLPVHTMLLAMEQAWSLRDQAFADVSEEELAQAWLAVQTRDADMPPIVSPDDMELLINAAILLTDTLDSILIPQLTAAANLGIWPAQSYEDSIGILRLGSTGNDVEPTDRLLQIDPRGDDTYTNNAGATTFDLDPRTPDHRVSISLDLAGDDTYRMTRTAFAQGAGFAGIGINYDLHGNDKYTSPTAASSQGAGATGIGIFRDFNGNDQHWKGVFGLGTGNQGIGIARDDAGDDEYFVSTWGGGLGASRGLGLFWDRGGTDEYDSDDAGVWGYVLAMFGAADGWYVDETTSTETWEMHLAGNGLLPHPLACNSCTWADGNGGHGNDNRGGLAYLIAHQAG